MEYKYFTYKIKMFITVLVIFGSLNTAFSQINSNNNIINYISNFINGYFKSNIKFEKYFYIIVGLAAIICAMNRDTWLPFLGETVLPSTFVPLHEHKGDTNIQVNVKPNTKVAYWSALPRTDNIIPTVTNAYGDYSNYGVVMSDDNGDVILSFNKGTSYTVPNGSTINPHVHYREINDDWGMMGPVQTYYL